MASRKIFSARFETETEYDRSAYEALSEVSWKMFREQMVRTRTYPFISALCILLTASLIAFRHKYSPALIAVQAAIILFFLISMPLSNETGKRRLCKKAIKEVSAQGPFPFTVRFLFNEEMVRAKLPADRVAETRYSRITDIVTYGKWLFLFVGDHAYILRQDAFESEEEYRQFEAFIAEKTGQTIWVIDVPRAKRRLAGLE